MGLDLENLRAANLNRLAEGSFARGGVKHNALDDWTPEQWFLAMVGELGEWANLQKKFNRGDFVVDYTQGFDVREKTLARYQDAVQARIDEIADVVIYLDLLAARLDIDLSQAVASKFNRKSIEVGSIVRLEPYGAQRYAAIRTPSNSHVPAYPTCPACGKSTSPGWDHSRCYVGGEV